MHNKIVFFLIAAFLLVNYLSQSQSTVYSRKKMRRIKLVYGLVVKNTGNHTINDLWVFIPEIQDYPPYQVVSINSVSPSTYTKEISSSGVPTFKFVIEKIKPGEQRKLLINADVTLWEVIFNVNQEEAKNPDESMSQYLLLDGYFNTNSEALKEKCRKFCQEKNPYKRAFYIYEYIISGTFSFSDSANGLGVDSSFEKKHLNCSDAALLYLVMCRLCGIPSRYIGGIFYSSSKKWYPLLHAWVEIYIPPFGWLPVDPTLGRLSEKHRKQCFAYLRNRYIALWNNQFSSFFIDMASEADSKYLQILNSIYAESYPSPKR